MAIRPTSVVAVTAAISAAFLLVTCGVVLAQGTAPTRPPYRLNQLTTQLSHTFPCNPTGSTAALQGCTLQSYFSWSGSTLGINTMVGDTGSGGVVGLVPAPAAGDAAAGKYLSAAGTYSAPAGGGGGSATVNPGTAGQLGYYATTSSAISGNANATISSGVLTLGQAGSIIGKMLLGGNTSGAITIQPQAAAGTYNFNLPIVAGSAGQPMLSGGGLAAPMTFGTLAVGGGGTGLTAGTSGGVPYFSSTSAMTSSAALTAHGVVVGGGAGTSPTSTAAGTAGQPLTSGGASADPTFGTLAVGGGGTGLTAGTSGGIPYFSSTSAMTSSTALTAHGVVVGGGTGTSPASTAAGTAGQALTSGGASADPTFGTLAVGGGGTGLTAGTSGGIPYFSSTSAITSSAALTAHGVVIGGGAGVAPTSSAAGTTGQVLTSNGAAADPTFQAGAGAALTTTDGTNTVTATTSQTFGIPFLVGTTGTGLATINLTQKVNSQTGGTYTIQTTDGTKVVEGGAFTYTYPLATLTAGFSTRVHNVGTSGNMTLSATGGNFTGLGVANATTFTLAPGEAADISTIAGPLGLVQKFTPSATGTTPTLIVPITYVPGINPNNVPITQINATRTITGIKCRPEVATGGTATISVVKAASGTALSAGTVLHSGSCNANGTAATDQTLTVTTSSLAAGDTLGLTTTGTTIWTNSGIATGVVTVYMQ